MKLLYSAITYGDNFLSFNDAFQLYLVSVQCKKLASKYLENCNMFAIYPSSNTTSNDKKSTYLIKHLNHKKIKQLYLHDYFIEEGIYVQFALQCINIRYLYLCFIYPYISTSLHQLKKLESIYIKRGLHLNDYITLKSLSCINTIRFKYDPDYQSISFLVEKNINKEPIIIIYHKTRPNNEYIKGNTNIILCCDHQFNHDLTRHCTGMEGKQCKIITPQEICQYLEYDN